MIKSLLLLILISQFLIFNSFSQSPGWIWAKAIGGTFNDYGSSVAVDAAGNVYTTGDFEGTVDFDPGLGIFNITSAGGKDIFISKLDNSGAFVWAKVMGGPLHDQGTSIAIDHAGSGDVFVTGYFSSDTVDFDPDTGVFNLSGAGVFIYRLNSSGNFVLAKALVGTSNSFGKQSIAVDPAGNGDILTSGSFSGTVDFDPGIGVYNLTTAGNGDIFISKLDSLGNFVWAKQLGGAGPDHSRAIAIDPTGSGHVYTVGAFYWTADFDPGAGVFNLTSAGAEDIFISKLDGSGNFVWTKAIGAYGNDYVNSIALDPSGSGDVYTTGWFMHTVDFDPGAAVFNLTSNGGFNSDIFISKLNGSGNFVWAKQIGGTYIDWGFSIAVDPMGSGDVYATGTFSGTVDFDPGPGAFNLTSVGGSWDVYISKLNSSGNFIWAKAIYGPGSEYGNSIALGASGNVHVTGHFEGSTISFDSTTFTNTDTVVFTSDIFIARLDTLANITGNNEIEIFDKDILLSPNPLSGSTTISFSLNQPQKISLKIFDVNGRLVSTLADKIFEAGENKLVWNVSDVEAGIYFLQFQSAENLKTVKLVITK